MRSAIRSSSMKEKRGGGSHHKVQRGRQHRESRMKKSQSSPTQLAQASTSDEDGEEEAALTSLHSLSIQLLDLMHTLHTRAASIFAAWAQEDGQNGEEVSGNLNPHIDAATGTLWATCWCPLLQGENDHIKHPSPLSRQPSLLLALVHHTDISKYFYRLFTLHTAKLAPNPLPLAQAHINIFKICPLHKHNQVSSLPTIQT